MKIMQQVQELATNIGHVIKTRHNSKGIVNIIIVQI